MEDLSFWAVGFNHCLYSKWQRFFSCEGWEIMSCPSDSFFSGLPAAGTPCIAFLKIPAPAEPAGLKTFLSRNPGTSIILVGEPGVTDNRAVADLLVSGADDFISADTDIKITAAKIKAHLRRLLPLLKRVKGLLKSKTDAICADCGSRVIRLGSGRNSRHVSNLTQKEFEIFCMLLQNEGEVVTREMILDRIWAEKAVEVNSETVDKHVESLRRKINCRGQIIKTVYGSGYKLQEA